MDGRHIVAARSPTFGISLPNRAVLFGVDTSELLDVTVRAEASGLLDSVWVGDNFFSQPRIESMVLLSAMAARTTRIRLGTLCLATFPMRHPLVFAVQWASKDLALPFPEQALRNLPHYGADLERAVREVEEHGARRA